jgi:hypothetical protein
MIASTTADDLKQLHVWPQQAELALLTLATGIPSHDTFRRVFMLIDAFEACFTAWAQSFAETFARSWPLTARRCASPSTTAGPRCTWSAPASRAGQRMASRTRSPRSRRCSRRCP